MKTLGMVVVLVAVFCVMSSPLMAWVQYKDGGTHNINYTINDDVWVDYQAPGMLTTVNLLNDGTIPEPYKLRGYNDCWINISGGLVRDFETYNDSTVVLTGGSVYSFYTYDDSRVVISFGGSISGFCPGGNSQIRINGGSVGGLSSTGSSRTVMTNGTAGALTIGGNSCLLMSGGLTNSYLWATDSSHVSWTGGLVIGSYMPITCSEQAIIEISGSDFAIDGIPVGFGVVTSILGGNYSSEPRRMLTGTLANGDIINNEFLIGNSALINLVPVPEPSSLLALCGGVAGILAFRRRRR